MESENGVNVEDESCAVETPQPNNSVVDLTKEGENGDSVQKAPTRKEISEPVAESENLSSSKKKIQASITVPKSKNVKASKVQSLSCSLIDRLSYMNGLWDSLDLSLFLMNL